MNNDALENFEDSSIAIISMAGRFPGAGNLEEYWCNLRDGIETISFLNDEESLSAGIDPNVIKDPNYIGAKGRLEDIGLFDATFFGFTPREAEITDPQHRLFLESAWAAVERAGYDPTGYKGRIGVFAGLSISSYWLNLYSNPDIFREIGAFQAVIANDKDHLPMRVSYKLNLRGPSVNVQTTCSTSLVAVHLACQSLLNGECDMALAGGVSIGCSRNGGYVYREGGINSPDGHCRAFDARAAGTVGGDGVAVVLLKRLEDALADRDNIDAVIRGSAINNDGASKVGYTAPSASGQANVILEALAMAGVRPETINYIECHGTGTAIGDPIEIDALTQAFRKSTAKTGFCSIGSVKTNIGHLDVASGGAGLIKTALSLKNRMIPPSLHFQEPNPRIDFANSPFLVNTQLREWRQGGSPRRAGVSSFGLGGTNAHLILEEAPAQEESDAIDSKSLLLLSARTERALEAMKSNLAEHLKKHGGLNIADVAYTLQVGRKSFEHRQMFVCDDIDAAASMLERRQTSSAIRLNRESKRPFIVFMFPGQGAQYVNMGRDLYQRGGVFREQVDFCASLLKPGLGLDIRDVIYSNNRKKEESEFRLRQTSIAQSALFVIEYSLARTWIDWGIKPDAMIGHSVGEYVAACLSGVMSLEDALEMVSRRARLMQQQPVGAMLAVGLSEQETIGMISDDLSLAAANAPSRSVISGSLDAIQRAENFFKENGVICSRLQTSHAFHSRLMEPVVPRFLDELRNVKLGSPKIPYLSNVTGNWITDAQTTDPTYWGEHIKKPVRFSDGLLNILSEKEAILLEIGPGDTLTTLARRQPATQSIRGVVNSMRRHDELATDEETLLRAIGKLWMAGVEIEWDKYPFSKNRRRVPLPTYPFERQKYWIDAKTISQDQNGSRPILKRECDPAKWFYAPTWTRLTPASPVRQDAEEKECWIVVLDRLGFAKRFVKELEQTGRLAWTIEPGSVFSKEADRAYVINPTKSSDYAQVISDIQLAGETLKKIVHFGGVTSDNAYPASVAGVQGYQQEGVYSLLSLTQALGIQNLTSRLEIIVVTNNIQDISGDERLQPEKATLISACKVIPQEYLNINCRNLDVVLPDPKSEQEKVLLDDLLAEMTSTGTASVVGYRNGRRWAQRFELIPVSDGNPAEVRLREEGVYLITGGLGRIGLICAEYLAGKARAKLVLTGRTGFPRREDWEQWILERGESDENSKKIRLIESLERMGAEIVAERADVADYDEMQGVVGRALRRFGRVNGVIHAAGVAGAEIVSAIQETTASDFERHFHPKVMGVYTLEKALEGIDLDFCLLFSSLSAVLGGLGFYAYAAANLFMDCFAVNKSRHGSAPWISVNWDGWRFAKKDVGAEELGILPEQGMEVLSRILRLRNIPQVVISSADLHARIAMWVNPEIAKRTEAKPSSISGLHPRPDLKNEYHPPTSRLEESIVTIWQALLGIEQIGVNDSFFELGGDSLMATQLVSRLRETFQAQIPLRDVFLSPTVGNMALLILQKQAEQIDSDAVARLLAELERQSA